MLSLFLVVDKNSDLTQHVKLEQFVLVFDTTGQVKHMIEK